MSKRTRNAGFTLVELLVVITIIGVLIAMVVPVASAVRETARSMSCQNNLHQLHVAASAYESRFQVLPMNWGLDKGGDNVVGHSWIALLLADLDNRPLYLQIKFGAPLQFRDEKTHKDNSATARQVLTAFRCPSDPGLGLADNQKMLTGEMVGITNYKASCGSNWPVDVLGGSSNGGGGGSGVKSRKGRNAGRTDAPDFCNGPMCRNRSEPSKRPVLFTTSSANIMDGPSKTILFGEAVPLWSAYSAWYWWDGGIATCGVPLNFRRNLQDPRDQETMATEYQYSSGFMSRHRAGGGNFAFCDGHSAWLANGVAPEIYRALATIDGEEKVSDDAF